MATTTGTAVTVTPPPWDPFDAPGHGTMALLDELVATAAIAGRAEQS